MRLSHCYALREWNHLVFEANEQFLERACPTKFAHCSPKSQLAPPGPRQGVFRRLADAGGGDHFRMFEDLSSKRAGKESVRIQWAPANLHWCSDEALTMLAECSENGVPFHMHVVKTAYQKDSARRHGGGSAVNYIAACGRAP